MKMTNGQIDRLGELIRIETGALKEPTVNSLQGFRTSHKDALSKVFNVVCSVSRQIQGKTITTYRIKRFQSNYNQIE